MTNILLLLVRLFRLAGVKIELVPLRRPEDAEVDSIAVLACSLRAAASLLKSHAFMAWVWTCDYAILSVVAASALYMPCLFWLLAQPALRQLVAPLPAQLIVGLALFPPFIVSGFIFAILKRGDTVLSGMGYAFFMSGMLFISSGSSHSLTFDLTILFVIVVGIRIGLALGVRSYNAPPLRPGIDRLRSSMIYSRAGASGSRRSR